MRRGRWVVKRGDSRVSRRPRTMGYRTKRPGVYAVVDVEVAVVATHVELERPGVSAGACDPVVTASSLTLNVVVVDDLRAQTSSTSCCVFSTGLKLSLLACSRSLHALWLNFLMPRRSLHSGHRGMPYFAADDTAAYSEGEASQMPPSSSQTSYNGSSIAFQTVRRQPISWSRRLGLCSAEICVQSPPPKCR